MALMAVEVVVQAADETGTLHSCMSYFGLPVDSSARITVISPDQRLRDDLVAGVCDELRRSGGAHGGCQGGHGAWRLSGCKVRNAAGTRQLGVVALPGPGSTPQLDATLQAFLAQPDAAALGVLPLGVSPATLPPAARPYQAVFYATGIREAVTDVLAAAGVEPEERRVFVSYNSADFAEAARLAEALAAQRFQVYFAPHSNAPASLWEEVLYDALIDAAMVVVIETANSVGARWVKREVGYAIARGAGVVAVQPGKPFPFTNVVVRFKGPPENAGAFVAEQHRLLVGIQRATRLKTVTEALNTAGVPFTADGGTVLAGSHLIGVFPRPVTPRQLRRTCGAAAASQAEPITFSPVPVLRVKRDDRRWLHDIAPARAFSDTAVRKLVKRVTP